MRRGRRSIPLLLVSLLLLTACSRIPTRKIQPPGSEAAADIQSVSVLTYRSDQALDALISAFYAKYPNYRVNKVTLANSAATAEAVKLRLSDGSLDLIPVSTGPISADELIASGQLAPLDQLIKKARLDLAPFGPLTEELRVSGELFELPLSVQPTIVIYNVEMFQAAGVPLPKAGWTWEEFRTAAKALTLGSDDNKVWGAATYAPQNLAAYMLYQRAPSNPLTDERALREALQFFNTLIATDRSMPPAAAGGANLRRVPFEQERAAMMLADYGTLNILQGQIKFKWNVAPLPILPGGSNDMVTMPVTYGIPAASKNPEAAFTFLQFAYSAEGAAALAKANQVPAYGSPEGKQAFMGRQPSPPAGMEAVLGTTWHTPRRGDPTYEKLIGPFSEMLTKALSGDGAWETALDQYLREAAQAKNR
jgi:ABC-type glycerol-3-phosphate transport system substrate-binding protein